MNRELRRIVTVSRHIAQDSRALAALEKRIESGKAELGRLLGINFNHTAEPETTPIGRKRRTMSASARRRISAAMKARWAARQQAHANRVAGQRSRRDRRHKLRVAA